MKFLHLSDLHLGKKVYEASLLEEQTHMLKDILAVVDRERPDAVLIAGDIYDRVVPPIQAAQLFDDFLYELSERSVYVFAVSGNHDSPERIAFASRLIKRSGVYLSPVYDATPEPVQIRDEYGVVNVYMLPFIRPAQVRRLYPDVPIDSYTDALRVAVNAMRVDVSGRNILIAHQFVTGAERSESEELSVGGTDNVDISVFEPFDYTALGHLHCAQSLGDGSVRYCGTPLKYSFSEASHEKSVTVVNLGQKGELTVDTIPLTPLRELRELRGTYDSLTARENYEGTPVDDYLHITLTDEEDVYDAVGKLRTIYPRLLLLDYDNARSRADDAPVAALETENRTPMRLFSEFYEKQNGRPLDETQTAFVEELIRSIWGECECGR